MMQTKDLEIDIVHHLDGCSVLHVYGDVNQKTSAELRAAIIELIERPSQEWVIVDLEGTTRLDSPAVSRLVNASAESRKAGVRLIFSSLRNSPRHAFELARLSSLVETTDTVGQALQGRRHID
jgi:anti-anti-sigma factor